MSVAVAAILVALAAVASILVAYRLIPPIPASRSAATVVAKPADAYAEHEFDRFAGAWQEEVQPLRETMLQLRLELVEVRRLSAIREAELRRLLNEAGTRLQEVEGRVERNRAAPGSVMGSAPGEVAISVAS